MIDEIARLFAWDDWANRAVLATLEPDGTPPRALEILAHVIGAEWLWHARLHGRPSPVAVWPAFGAAECREQLDRLRPAWRRSLDALAPDRLGTTLDYVNSKGERWRSSAGDVLLHVVLHSSYHRGQIATLLGAAGKAPAYTDYIHAVRQGLIGG